MNGNELLAIARDRYPEVVWELTPEGLRGSDPQRRVCVVRFVGDDPPVVVVEATRGHLRKAKPLGGRR